jgi:dihydroneopterin aldolase
MAKIALYKMPFWAYHGVQDFERQYGNQFELDLEAHADITQAGQTDDVRQTVDYTALYEIVRAEMKTGRRLLEYVVAGIGRRVLAEHSEVEAVMVRLSKLNPPIAGICERTTVEETYRR